MSPRKNRGRCNQALRESRGIEETPPNPPRATRTPKQLRMHIRRSEGLFQNQENSFRGISKQNNENVRNF